MRKFQIISTGKHLPTTSVASVELDNKLGLKPGTLEGLSGIQSRYHVNNSEFSNTMGAQALVNALDKANLKLTDLDAIISTAGTMAQAIPCTAALIKKEAEKLMKAGSTSLPCFDVNATCLSFVTGLDVGASLLSSDRFKRIALVASEVGSVGLNPAQHEAYALFGDGAACAIIEQPGYGSTAGTLHSSMETYAEGTDTCRILAGGTNSHPTRGNFEHGKMLFEMEGRKVFKLVLEKMPSFMENFLKPLQMNINDFKLVIPHQASGSGMELVRRKLSIREDRWMNILSNHGNMIAASIPLALHYAIEEGRIARGDRVLLLGTSAGMSIGAFAFEY